MSGNGLSINDLLSILNLIAGNQIQNLKQTEQSNPLAENLLPLVEHLLNKGNKTSENNASISDFALMPKNVIDQQALPKKELKKMERGLKKALEKDGIHGALEYLANKLQTEEEPNDQ